MNTMLTALNLGNFKAFAETQNIPIRPLTLIFGVNSAGKSSILHGLLFAREAMENGTLDVNKTVLAGDSVDLGGFKQFIHRHKKDANFLWGADLESDKYAALLPAENPQAKDIHLAVHITDTPFGVAVMRIEVSLMGQPFLKLSPRSDVMDSEPRPFTNKGIRHGTPGMTEFWGVGTRFLIESLDFEHPLIQLHVLPTIEMLVGRKLGSTDRKKINSIVEDATFSEITALIENFIPECAELLYPDDSFSASFKHNYPELLKWLNERGDWADLRKLKNTARKTVALSNMRGIVTAILFATLNDLLAHIYNSVAKPLGKMTYLGPLRSYPERHCALSEKQNDWYSRGDHAWDVLCNNSEVRDKTNEWLKRMKIHYEIKPRIWRTAGEQKRELALVDTRNRTAVSHRDIGVGVSQMLPTIATACGSQNQIHAIEQPEIHVHPALQAELGDLFIESALGKQKNTFLLETHSEHLLLRIMRRMRETSAGKLPKGILPVRPSDVAVLYVQPDGTRSIVREMPLNERGELLKQWPGGFFEEGLKEVLPSYDR